MSQLLRGELDWIVMKALEKDRSRRYETASDFAADVLRYLNDEPVEACPPSAWYRLRKFVRKYRMAILVAAGFAVLLVAGVTVSTWQAMRASDAERLATQHLAAMRHQALERAMLEAMSSNFDAAEVALQEAALAGASTGQARMVDGLMAYYHGDFPTALARLEQAMQLMPESVAARGNVGPGLGSYRTIPQTGTRRTGARGAFANAAGGFPIQGPGSIGRRLQSSASYLEWCPRPADPSLRGLSVLKSAQIRFRNPPTLRMRKKR